MTKKDEKLQEKIDELEADIKEFREKYEAEEKPPPTDGNPWR